MIGYRICPVCEQAHPVMTTCAGGWCDERADLDDVRVRQAPTRLLEGHICGWAEREGRMVCVQDYRAVGFVPESACGAVWNEMRRAA